ncbi:MAG: YdcF family protein [Erysipelotrichaceae bacterium]|nr:YdcF family protein [Erysipelotrichaceae bacterium]
MRFDTIDKKPNLFGIIYASIVMLVFLIIFIIGKQEEAICLLIMAYLLVVLYILGISFIRQLQYNPYSYNTIYYAGFFLFIFFILITIIRIFLLLVNNVEGYIFMNVVSCILSSAKNYMLLTFPLILVFSIGLVISNISLIRHEGKSLSNFLAIILAILMIAGEVILYRYDFYASGSQFEVMVHDIFANSFAAIYLYFECMVIGTIIAFVIVSRYEPNYDKEFMIVLGCGLMKDGSLTPLLKGRVDRALQFYNNQKKLTGKELTFIPSGGQGPDEVISESEAMKRYLLSQGIKEELIVKEDKSGTTEENMAFSKKIIEELDPEADVAFSTTNYHVFRAGLFARRVKMRAQGVGAKTKWYFMINATVREFVGLLTRHIGKQSAILIGMIVFYIVLTLIYYHF